MQDMRLTVRSIGLLLVALGIWGAIVPFAGPEFNYPFPAGSDVGAWEWSDTAWQLSLLPGIAAAYGGLILLGLVGSVRIVPAVGAFVALTAGAWFVLGAEFSRLWTSPPPAGTGSDWLVIATNVGYHEGLGLAISVLAGVALGLLALLPERIPAAAPPATPHPVLDHDPNREYDGEPARTG